MSQLYPNNQYEILLRVYDAQGQFLRVSDPQITYTTNEILAQLQGITDALQSNQPIPTNQSLLELLGQTGGVSGSLGGVYATGFPTEYLPGYPSGTTVYTGSSFICLVKDDRLTLNINDNLILNRNGNWQPFSNDINLINDIWHLLYISGITFENVTSIHTDRFDYNQNVRRAEITEAQKCNLFLTSRFTNDISAQGKYIREFRIPPLPNCKFFVFRNENLSQQSIDQILISLAEYAPNGGYIDLKCPFSNKTGLKNAYPSTAGQVAIQKLIIKDWKIEI